MDAKVIDAPVAAQDQALDNQQRIEVASRELLEAELLAVGGGTGEVTW